MRHQWYGDGRDFIKWGVLVHLEKNRNIRRIIQIAYIRPDSQRPLLEWRKESFPLPEAVWSQSRDIQDIRRLATVAEIEIDVIDAPFDAKARASYTKKVIEHRRSTQNLPTLLFLDPDTGIAEQNAKPEHVTPAEVRDIWTSMKPADLLVLYQHSNRHKEWLPKKRTEFEKAIKTPHTETFRAKSGAKDAAFFCASKQ